MTNYQRGRAKEYRVMEKLRNDGWLVARTAGSHTPVDIFAARDGKRLVIQVKSGSARMTPKEKNELIQWGKAFGAESQIWWFRNRIQIEVFDTAGEP